MHIVAVELVAKLREAIKDHLADLNDLKLQRLKQNCQGASG